MSQTEFKNLLKLLVTEFIRGDLEFKNVKTQLVLSNRIWKHVDHAMFQTLQMRIFPQCFPNFEQYSYLMAVLLVFEHFQMFQQQNSSLSLSSFFTPLLEKQTAKTLLNIAIVLRQNSCVNLYLQIFQQFGSENVVQFIDTIKIQKKQNIPKEKTPEPNMDTVQPVTVPEVYFDEDNEFGGLEFRDLDYFDFNYEQINETPTDGQQKEKPKAKWELSKMSEAFLQAAPKITQQTHTDNSQILNKILYKKNDVNPLFKQKKKPLIKKQE
ncbi:Hypothetical_protein [Hexamita inflata]|uniref:Hypothetical_protein n=1 Tax=Hexamita inflata TaxID=28002 RepID=A0AA86UUA7_9EUKA|nr:Hypothetical protein HINF_LOCUS37443 [Hexamita inflata]